MTLIGLVAPAWPGRADAPPDRYTYPAAGTVYDTRTKLTWQQIVDSNTYAWVDAKTYCATLTLAGSGWRLPAVSELLTIVDPTRVNPSVDPTAFPGTPMRYFWSSSPSSRSSGSVWAVEFWQGSSNHVDPASTYLLVRCVR
jgi:hypothetical protein